MSLSGNVPQQPAGPFAAAAVKFAHISLTPSTAPPTPPSPISTENEWPAHCSSLESLLTLPRPRVFCKDLAVAMLGLLSLLSAEQLLFGFEGAFSARIESVRQAGQVATDAQARLADIEFEAEDLAMRRAHLPLPTQDKSPGPAREVDWLRRGIGIGIGIVILATDAAIALVLMLV